MRSNGSLSRSWKLSFRRCDPKIFSRCGAPGIRQKAHNMTTADKAEEALVLLENISDENSVPAMVILPQDTGKFIIGNRAGLIKLAIASLRAARGEEYTFKDKSWVSNDDLDWAVKGLSLDPSAHLYLPTKQTRLQRLRNNFFSLSLLAAILVCMFVGFITLAHWFIKILW